MADSFNGNRDFFGVGDTTTIIDDATKAVLVTSQKPHGQQPIVHDSDASGTRDSSANSGSDGTGGSHATSSFTLAPGVVAAVEASIDARFPHQGAFNPLVDNVTRAETPGEQAAQKLLNAVDHGSHLGEPIKPSPSPFDPDLGDPNKPPHPTPINPAGETTGASHDGFPGVPSVLTHLANGLPVPDFSDGSVRTINVSENQIPHAASGVAIHDGTSNTISISELTAAFNGQHPVGDLPPPSHGGGVIDPPPSHVTDSALHTIALVEHNFDPVSHAPAVHFDAFHH